MTYTLPFSYKKNYPLTSMSISNIIKLPNGIEVSFAFKPGKEVSQVELDLAATFSNHKRKLAFILGRTAAHQALEKLGLRNAIILKANSGAPVWPKGFCGSIAHSVQSKQQAAAVALAASEENYKSIGLDIECLDRVISPKLIKKICNQSEIALISKTTSALLIFSCKEAIYKCLFPICQQYFGYLDASLIQQPAEGVYDYRINRQLNDSLLVNTIIRVYCHQYKKYLISYCYLIA